MITIGRDRVWSALRAVAGIVFAGVIAGLRSRLTLSPFRAGKRRGHNTGPRAILFHLKSYVA